MTFTFCEIWKSGSVRIAGFLGRIFSIAIFAFVLGSVLGSGAHALETGDRLIEEINAKFTGDFEEMKAQKLVRVLVPYSQTYFFIDAGRMRGLTAELAHEFEKHLNKKLKLKGPNQIVVAMVPTPRDEILPAIVDGRGDLAMAGLTITPERRESVDFSVPLYSGVEELIVTNANRKPIERLPDLAGMEIHVRRSSSHFDSLARLNKRPEFKNNPVKIVEADESLEDEELFEMVNAGLIEATVGDSHTLRFWQRVYPNIQVNDDLSIREEGEIAWAFRKDSPEFEAVINDFVAVAKKGTSIGNTLIRRYLDSTKWLKNITSDAYSAKLKELRDHFERFGKEYNIDWRIIAAVAFQESKFDQSARSKAGAVGIMQIKPSTARDPSIGIKDVSKLDNNIHAAVKYLRYVVDTYFDDPQIDEFDRILMALASYNAGPNAIARVRTKLDNSDDWFGEVELAVASSVGAEPVRYVSNVFRYYVIIRGISEKADAASPKSQHPTIADDL